MSRGKKRKASINLSLTQTESLARKSARLTLPLSSRKDSTHGVSDRFPWASLPTDVQERIMSELRVRETARFTCAIKSRDVLAIHRDMMRKRHDALREVLRDRFGDEAARLMPPLDMADPGDVYVTPQVPLLLQLRPHRKPYRMGTVTEVERSERGERVYKLAGWCQGYFTRAGLEGWGRWDASVTWAAVKAKESFVGEWRAGKRHWGTWTSYGGGVGTGDYINDRQHGLHIVTFPHMEGHGHDRYEAEFENGKLLTYRLTSPQV